MARATSSLPVPLSPVIKTRLDWGATVWIRSQLAPQVAGFLLPAEVFGHLAHGAAELVNQFMVLDDVTVRPGVDGGDGGLERGHAGDQQKHGVRRNFFGEF